MARSLLVFRSQVSPQLAIIRIWRRFVLLVALKPAIRVVRDGLIAIVFAGVPLSCAAASIYINTGDEASISLSNVAEGRQYQVLLSDDVRANRSAPMMASAGTASRARELGAKARFDEVVGQVAATYGIESALLHAVISVESGYNPAAVSPKGARGLMQLMPKTASRYGVTNSLDPAQNVDGGARYLRDLLKQFNSELPLVLAAYNAGENAVVRYGNQIPPFRETVAYVPKVLGYYESYQAR